MRSLACNGSGVAACCAACPTEHMPRHPQRTLTPQAPSWVPASLPSDTLTAVASCAGACMGTSPCTVYIESATGARSPIPLCAHHLAGRSPPRPAFVCLLARLLCLPVGNMACVAPETYWTLNPDPRPARRHQGGRPHRPHGHHGRLPVLCQHVVLPPRAPCCAGRAWGRGGPVLRAASALQIGEPRRHSRLQKLPQLHGGVTCPSQAS